MKTHTMKISPVKLAAVVLLGAALLAVTGCYYVPGLSGAKARAGLVVPRSIAVNTTSIALIVGGPGMEPLYMSYTTLPASISIDVPSGVARTFTLLLNSPSATLQGEATVDLQPGETKDIILNPTLAGTQIVIPDYQNFRIVQISDMNGTGWTTVTGANLPSTINPTGLNMTPYAIDFDNMGRIYIANSNSGIGGLLRIDDIGHPSSGVVVDSVAGVTSLAVDRANGLVYYGTGSTTLYKKDVNNIAAGSQSINLASENSNIIGTTGLAADDQGVLYTVAYLLPLYTRQVIKYDPTLPVGSRIVATSAYSSFTSAFGIMAKGAYVYVNDSGAAKVVRFDKNLNFVDSFGGPPPGFYGPEAFVATLNRKITVIDEKSGFNDRLASFDDMTGAGWTTFGTYGTGVNTFDFYSVC